MWRSLAAQAICNRQVGGSNPSTGTCAFGRQHPRRMVCRHVISPRVQVAAISRISSNGLRSNRRILRSRSSERAGFGLRSPSMLHIKDCRREEDRVIKGFKNFMLQGELIVIAVGLVVALAFSTLIKAFTDSIITPLVNAAEGSGPASSGLGWTLNGQRIELGAFISAVVYFVIFMAVIYFILVVPYRAFMARRGTTVFGPPPATKTCPQCLSSDLPAAASKCRHCASEVQ